MCSFCRSMRNRLQELEILYSSRLLPPVQVESEEDGQFVSHSIRVTRPEYYSGPEGPQIRNTSQENQPSTTETNESYAQSPRDIDESALGAQSPYDIVPDGESYEEDTTSDDSDDPPSALDCTENIAVTDQIYIHPNKCGANSTTNNDTQMILLLRKELNGLLEKNKKSKCLTDIEVQEIIRQIDLCNKVAHPTDDASRQYLISIYDTLLKGISRGLTG